MRFKFSNIMIFCLVGFLSVASVSFGETSENQVVPVLIKNAILAEDWNTVAEQYWKCPLILPRFISVHLLTVKSQLI